MEKGERSLLLMGQTQLFSAVTASPSVELFYAPLYLEEYIIMKNLFVQVSPHAIFFPLFGYQPLWISLQG